MKNLIKIAFVAIMALLFSTKNYAQINVTNGSNYYVCQGEDYTFELPQTGILVYDPNFWEFDSTIYECSSAPCILANGVTVNNFDPAYVYNCNTTNTSPVTSYYGVNVTLNTAVPVKVAVAATLCNGDGDVITFTITPYVTSIIGDTGICGTSAVTYTAAINGGLTPTAFSWVLPTFLSGTSSIDEITANGSAKLLTYGTISVTDNGCPAGSASNTDSITVNNVPNAPTQAPGAMGYRQFGVSCWWNAAVSTVPNATQYQWSWDSSFTPTDIFATTGTPETTNGPFYYDSYTYTVYVRGINECGNGPYKQFIKETPPAPEKCLHQPIERDTNQNQESTLYNVYKVYPNPAGNSLTVEYPKPANNAALSFTIYNMLGQKVASWNLQAAENSAFVNTSVLPAGLYIYEIVSANALVARGKLMIQR